MNTTFLQHPNVKEKVIKIWTAERRESATFFTGLSNFIRFYKSFYKKQAAESMRMESNTHQALVEA
jgi:hypothetical protein